LIQDQAVRTTIYIPGRLARKLKLLKGRINVSRVCVEALEKVIDQHIADLIKELEELQQ
jgi:demethoxyubiquinone hydroxylase (CLK1/Coq7/Cat5 family)